MNPGRRPHPTKRHKQNQKWLVLGSALAIFLVLFATFYFWHPAKKPSEEIEPAGFVSFKDHYLSVMRNLNSSETKAKMATQLDSSYNQTDLFNWEQSRLTFAQDSLGWQEDPIGILESGKGICVQFSIVYVASCLANGYPSRLVVATDTGSWNTIHVWAEDYLNGAWIHVDPSDRVWNSPSRYQSWDWGKGIGSDVKIYAFEDGAFEDVTSTYISH